MDDNKYVENSKPVRRQELERRHRQTQKNRVIAESNEFSFDDFVLLLIIMISLLLCDVLGSAF